nr:hypothetical protein [uncultured Dongia sp.]
MGVQFRQNTKGNGGIAAKGVVATMSGGKRPGDQQRLGDKGFGLRRVARQHGESQHVDKRAADNVTDAMATLRALAQAYEQVADSLLARIHDHGDDLKAAHTISRHLDWVGARAQLVDSFIKAGDCALTYICASQDAHDRLMPLVQLAAHNAATPGRLPVALFLMEKIDEELRLV